MTNLVNQDTNADSNLKCTYLNYVNPAVGGEPLFSNSGFDLTTLLTTAWGNVRTAWTKHASTNASWAVRFPGITETLTGNIVAPTSQNLTTGSRCVLPFLSSLGPTYNANSTNSTSNVIVTMGSTAIIDSTRPYFFAVVNSYAICYVGFSSVARTTCDWVYHGWLRNGSYTGSQFPRNFTIIRGTNSGLTSALRVNTENLTTTQALYSTSDLGGAGILNPAVDCTVTTSGADTIEIILRDSGSPYNYIGQPYFLIQAPSSCVVGKIYKNTSMSGGVDWEGSSNAFWMCIGVWGGRKLLMRVWTENII